MDNLLRAMQNSQMFCSLFCNLHEACIMYVADQVQKLAQPLPTTHLHDLCQETAMICAHISSATRKGLQYILFCLNAHGQIGLVKI